MDRGVHRFSLNEVLRGSGGSKATVTKYFGDRMGLIAAVIGVEARETMAALILNDGQNGHQPLQQGLARILGGVLHFYLQPAALSLYRAVIATAEQDAASTKAFYEGHGVVVDAIASFLAARQGSDVREGLDCHAVAELLAHAIRAGLYERALLNLEPLPIADLAIAQQVDQTLTIFLRGVIASP